MVDLTEAFSQLISWYFVLSDDSSLYQTDKKINKNKNKQTPSQHIGL